MHIPVKIRVCLCRKSSKKKDPVSLGNCSTVQPGWFVLNLMFGVPKLLGC